MDDRVGFATTSVLMDVGDRSDWAVSIFGSLDLDAIAVAAIPVALLSELHPHWLGVTSAFAPARQCAAFGSAGWRVTEPLSTVSRRTWGLVVRRSCGCPHSPPYVATT
eukprot:2110008-Prymnesium_polylepis.1